MKPEKVGTDTGQKKASVDRVFGDEVARLLSGTILRGSWWTLRLRTGLRLRRIRGGG